MLILYSENSTTGVGRVRILLVIGGLGRVPVGHRKCTNGHLCCSQ